MTPEVFLAAVVAERARGEALHPGMADLPDSTDNPSARKTLETIARNAYDRAVREGRATHAYAFEEETSEALAAAAEGDVEGLRRELVQVAAYAFKWLDALERRGVSAK